MDWRLDRRDGLYKLLDFNPRVGASSDCSSMSTTWMWCVLSTWT